MFYRQYYSEVGKLLYALAHVDGTISTKEKTALKEIVRNELVPNEKHTDKFGTDAAYYVEIEFEILDETEQDAEAAFESFLFFVEEHATAIDNQMRKATIKIATRLADSFHKTNKKEAALLKKLKAKLESTSGKIPQHS